MKGPHSARELANALSEGYEFKENELKVIAGLPKYLKDEFNRALAAKLKTPALRAAYLEAIRQAEAGKGMDALARVLRVAFYERNRSYANRIARTELHRNYTDRLARELMAEDQIQYVQICLSSKHPKPDICDRHAQLDAWGLGPGVYPKAEAPKPPFHPHCSCLVAARIDLFPKKPPRFNPQAERALLASLPPNEARRVAGSRENLERALKGDATLEEIYNEGKDPLYRWRRLGEVGQDGRMIDAIDDPGKGPDRGRLRTRPVGLSGLSSEQAQVLAGRELDLARRTGTEKAYGVAKDGRVVVEREGAEDRIIFDDDELVRLAGCVLTHNHPSGRSFSLADIQLAAQHHLTEIRTVTRRFVFRARPPEEGWPVWETAIYPHIAEALREATRQTLIEAEKYHWNAAQADQARQHAFMRILSKRCGFRYHQESE